MSSGLKQRVLSLLAIAGLMSPLPALAGTLERITVHGASLENNLSGDSPDREVFVYLPDSYGQQPERRYPVLYFLHGYSATAQRYVDFMGLPGAIDEAIAGAANEMLVVLPDAFSPYSGSMYSSSPVTGDWETFIADELVSYIDNHYRTLAAPQSRGLSGHSMGGYGTLRIGMKRPGVFGALYAMSSCCLMNISPQAEAVAQQEARMSEGPVDPTAGFANVLQAQAAAWAPNPHNPPYYFDWPFKQGEEQPGIQAKWAANSPLIMVDQYVPALNSYRAIMLDVGDADSLAATNHQLDEALSRLGVSHGFQEYEGDHGNRVATRFANELMGFFTRYLDAQ